MQTISFDRAVGYYDSTRGFAPGVDHQIRDSIVRVAGATPDTRFVELGVGTGLIAVPFIEAGYPYLGADISIGMMSELQRKLGNQHRPNYALLRANLMQPLPLATSSVDVVILIRILHLLTEWRAVLGEVQRSLRKPQGQLIALYEDTVKLETVSDANETNDPHRQVDRKWDAILGDLHYVVEQQQPRGTHRKAEVAEFLTSMGAEVQTVTLFTYQRLPVTLRGIAQRHKDRLYSADWLLPDALHQEAWTRMEAWLATQFPDTPILVEAAFSAVIARWV
jgi:ubiquinone/menaquinone biosynthesis C-methylase UbiE